jgi:hypothetical protein
MESYPVPQLKTLEDVTRYLNTVREYRERDITNDKLYQQALYQLGFKKTTLSLTASAAIGPTDGFVDVATGAGAVTVTLIDSPTDNQFHIISKQDASANNITIDGNGKNINGAATISWNTQYQGRLLFYVGGLGEWRALVL